MTETFFRLYNYEVLFSYNTYIIISIYLTTLITYPKNNAYPPCHPTQLPSYATYVQSDPSMFPSIINKSVKGRFFSSLFLSNYLPILISIYPSIYSSFCRAFLSIKSNISLPVLQSSTLPWCRRTRRCSQGASGRAPSDLCLQIPRSPRVHRYQGTIWSIPQNQVNTTACLVFMR